MLKFTDKVIGKISLDIIEMTEQDIESIIVSSFEGGSNYWMGLDNTTEGWSEKPKDEPLATWATKLILEGKSIKLYDIEETDDDTNWILTLDKILEGFKLNAIHRPFASDKNNFDAADADCIIQYALFGEVVYG